MWQNIFLDVDKILRDMFEKVFLGDIVQGTLSRCGAPKDGNAFHSTSRKPVEETPSWSTLKSVLQGVGKGLERCCNVFRKTFMGWIRMSGCARRNGNHDRTMVSNASVVQQGLPISIMIHVHVEARILPHQVGPTSLHLHRKQQQQPP